MGRSQYPPQQPKYTCPLIDNVLELLDTDVKEEMTESDISFLKSSIKTLMEDIRFANRLLRDHGEWWQEEAEEKEEEVESLNKKISVLQDEIYDLNLEMKEAGERYQDFNDDRQ